MIPPDSPSHCSPSLSSAGGLTRLAVEHNHQTPHDEGDGRRFRGRGSSNSRQVPTRCDRFQRRRKLQSRSLIVQKRETSENFDCERRGRQQESERLKLSASTRRMTRGQRRLAQDLCDSDVQDDPVSSMLPPAVDDMQSRAPDEERHLPSPDVSTENKGLPLDPRHWTRDDVRTWLTVCHSSLDVDAARFPMNGKALCIMNIEMFNYRVPQGGATLYADFRRRLCAAISNQKTAANEESFQRFRHCAR